MIEKKSKTPIVILASGLLLMYMTILLIVLFGIVGIAKSENCVYVVLFQVISFIIISSTVIFSIVSNNTLMAYRTGMVTISLMYCLFVNALNIWGASRITIVHFIVLHLVVIFIWLLIWGPFMIMAYKKINNEYKGDDKL